MSEQYNADTQSYSHLRWLMSEQYNADTHTYSHLCLLTSEASWVASLPRVCRARSVLREEMRSSSQASPGIHLHHHPICIHTLHLQSAKQASIQGYVYPKECLFIDIFMTSLSPHPSVQSIWKCHAFAGNRESDHFWTITFVGVTS